MSERKSTVASLFGKSPFKPMQAHMRVAVACAHEIPGLFQLLIAGDSDGVTAAKERIFALEGEADALKNSIRIRLPKSLFMPVDRRDLLELLRMQDSIADTAQDIAGLLVERPMAVPEAMAAPLVELVRACVDACDKANEIIDLLDELLAIGFKGKTAARVREMVSQLNDLEHHTDDLGLRLARTLFQLEDEMKPVSVMMWYRLIEWIGDLADYAEKVGNRVRLLTAK